MGYQMEEDQQRELRCKNKCLKTMVIILLITIAAMLWYWYEVINTLQ